MRTLYILRHGEAVKATGVDDRDRALTPAGLAAMQELAPLLAGMEVPPGLALCSPALRTRQTQRAAAPALPVRIVEDLYDAPAETLLAHVREVDDSHRAVLLVAHNPGVQQLTMMLSQAGDDNLRMLAAAAYVPGMLAVIESHLPRWEAIAPDNTRLVNLLAPPYAAGSAA